MHITNTVSGEWLLVHPLPYYSQCVTYIRQMCRYQCCCDTYCILRKWYSCCVSLKSKNIEAFQSDHHVSFILCYMIYSHICHSFPIATCCYNLLSYFSCLRSAPVDTEQMSTGHLVPLFFPLSEFVKTCGKI